MSESHVGTLLNLARHGRLHSSFDDLDSVDGWTAALTLAKAISVTLLCGFVAKIMYNGFLHPLRKVPGPWWYGASGLPRYWYTKSGQAHQRLRELHEEYGDVVRTSPNEVSFIGPRAWPQIYNHTRISASKNSSGHGHGLGLGQHDFLENGKERLYFDSVSAPSSIIHMPKQAHITARKTLNSAFSAKAVADQEALVKGHIDMLVTKLREAAETAKESNTGIDIAAYINWTLFDVIGDLAFGEPFGSLAAGAEHKWVSMVPNAVKGGVLRANVIRLLGTHLGKAVMRFLVPGELRNTVAWHRALSAEKFERRRKLGDSRPDFLAPMFGDTEFWSTQRMQGTATSLITAGSETSSTTLTTAVYYLASTPAAEPGGVSAWTRLTEEVRSHFVSDDEITFASARPLPFLAAVIEETMRLHPPVASGLPREAREGGVVIEGYYIPGKTSIAVPQYAAYRSERNFFDADGFRPERWLGTDSRFANDHKEAFQPFSYGPRNCLGKYLAYAEMRAILARIVYNFDIELRPESRGWDNQRTFVVWDKGPLYVNLKSRF